EIENVLAVTIKAENIPSREIENAKKVAKEIGLKHVFLEFDIFKNKDFLENSENRCYYCKKSMICAMTEIAKEKGYEVIFEGTNGSDLQEHRPGYKAVLDSGIAFSPWACFGIKKEEIRAIAKDYGFSFYNSPSLSCLATRIPFKMRITLEMLRRIDKAENLVIKIAKVRNVRVRVIKNLAVVEVERDEIWKVMEFKEVIKDSLLSIGFEKVFINPDGYKSGIFASDLKKLLPL
ncbi:MAG: ATP-dependent sacrificial sulfur transferase LarE, partial [Archaeoglobaceae archaeon]